MILRIPGEVGAREVDPAPGPLDRRRVEPPAMVLQHELDAIAGGCAEGLHVPPEVDLVAGVLHVPDAGLGVLLSLIHI